MDTTTITASTATAAATLPMRALLQSAYGTTDVLSVGTAPRPSPREAEVLVQVRAAGIDRGTWHLLTGRPYLMRLLGFGFSRPNSPVPGLDLAGTVVEVGPNVSRFRVGDEVFGIGEGAFAEYARAREDKLAHKPEGLSFEQAAVFSVSGSSALQALHDVGKLQAGERVLIIGASGGVGTFAAQLAKAAGAVVTGVCRSEKVATVQGLGADHVIDYTQRDFADGTEQYDLIVDNGGNTALSRLRRAMTPNGRLVFVGAEDAGNWTGGFGRVLLALALGNFVQQRFAMLGAIEHYRYLEQLAEHAQTSKLTAVIDRRITLDDVALALRDLEAGKVCGKVVVNL